MQVEPSVCDPFPMQEASAGEHTAENQADVRFPNSPSSSGLDLTGASISSVTGEDGERFVTWHAPSLVECHRISSMHKLTYNSIRAAKMVFIAGQRNRDAPSIVLPHQDASYISHIALDIGGSLVKLVYFSSDKSSDDQTLARSNSGINKRHTGGISYSAHQCNVQRSMLPLVHTTLLTWLFCLLLLKSA